MFLRQAGGGYSRDSELVTMQRRGDFGVLALKWDVYNTTLVPQAQEVSWKRGWKETSDREDSESMSSGCDNKDTAV